MPGGDDSGGYDDDDDPSFTRVLPANLSNFNRDLSQIIHPLSADDQQALRPVLDKQQDVDVQYSISDINILRSIVQLALRSEQSTHANSFITIFKGYEAVLHRRRIDPSKDTFYFKLVVKLCRADGTTWPEKFNNLLREINASLLSRKKPQLTARYKHLLLGLLRRKLQSWRARARDQKARSLALRRAAIKYDNATLASQAFEIWRTKLRILLAQHNILLQIVDHHEAKAFFDRWRHKTNHVRASRDSAANAFRKAIIFSKWRTKSRKLSHLNQLAAQLERARHGKILRNGMRTWVYQMYFHGAQQVYNHNLAQKYLDTWVVALSDIENLADRADIFRRDKARRTVLAIWRHAAAQVSGLRHVAAAFERRVVLRTTWLVWTRQLDLAYAAHDYDLVRNLACVARALDTWRRRTALAIHADGHYETSLMARHMKRMREQLRVAVMVDMFDKRRKRNVLYAWVLHERAQLLGRVHSRKLVAQSFKRWKRAAVRRIDRDRRAVKKVYGETNYRIASSALKVWRAKLHDVRQIERTALHRYELATKRNVWPRLVSALRQIRQFETTALDLHRANGLKFYLAVWRDRLRLRRHEHRENVLHALLSRKRVQRCQHILASWVQRTTEKIDLAILAAEYFEDSSRKLVSAVLRMWRNRIVELVGFEATAAQFDRASIMASAFAKWNGRKLACDEMQQRAVVVYDINSLLRAQSILRRWNMSALQIGILTAKADVFADKWSNTKTRGLFGRWVDATRERRRELEPDFAGIGAADDDDDDLNEDDDGSGSGTIIAAATMADESLTYTPTRRPRVSFAGVTNTPSVERWARLRNSPMYEGRRKLFATPATKSRRDVPGRTV
ncbi:Sfi1 spindle body protein-domain-containing protein [Lipomyces orientalis]|uniref:Sfi1 spindle body protein-domain-containing protein n=1 Tax=Lipomyces orientalis TaxID=1233043 RepID=A0ACC3TSK7_9ASCO